MLTNLIENIIPKRQSVENLEQYVKLYEVIRFKRTIVGLISAEDNRQDGSPGEDTMLDRPGLAYAVEDLHELGQLHPLYSPYPDNRGLLCCDRGHYMVTRGGITPGTH